jgi:hypothetical protein
MGIGETIAIVSWKKIAFDSHNFERYYFFSVDKIIEKS